MACMLSDVDGKPVLKLTGAVGIAEGAELKEALLRLIESTENPTVAMDGVTEVDVCTLQLLVAAQKSAAKAGKSLNLADISEPFQQAAELAGLESSKFKV
ncbi:MAG: STAS domain-containing protein [Desulfovibrionales bacterium]|nr:STAS domain-containing protein [Desulfovibrionales bacterium]